MKANELMVGDFVTRQNYENKAVVCKIIGLSKNSISVEFDNGSRSMGASEDSINPITLTPEILEKNGWTYNDENTKFHPNTWSGNGIMLKKEIDCFRIVVVSDYDDEDTNDTPFLLRYVSDLQHALKLLKIEKEIVL